MEILKPEIEEGNIEYKRFLINIDNTRLEHLATQMKWRLEEGDNEAIYYLGVNDNGSVYQMNKSEKEETLKNFNLLVEKNQAEIINWENPDELYYKITIRKVNPILPEIRVLLLGDSESGKTTFLANLILNKSYSEKIDPRIYLMNHKHELESKKTSSVNCNYITYDKIKYVFIEAPGYHEYSRTKFKLLLGTCPDIILLFVNPDGNPSKFDKFIVDNLSIPYFPIDIFNLNSEYNSRKQINKANLFSKINQIYKPNYYTKSQAKINVLNVYPHNDLGIVVSGFLESGKIKIGQQLTWTYRDETSICKVNSIHINSEPTNEICTNQMLTLCLKTNNKIKKSWKHGILSSIELNETWKEIKFTFQKFSNSIKLPNSLYGFCSNRIVHIFNIRFINGQFTGIIRNYIQGDNLIIVDFDSIKGIVKII
jgi:GTPase